MKKPMSVDVGNGPMTYHGLGFWMRLYERARALRIRRRAR